VFFGIPNQLPFSRRFMNLEVSAHFHLNLNGLKVIRCLAYVLSFGIYRCFDFGCWLADRGKFDGPIIDCTALAFEDVREC
jgi:hypothetical protein